MKSKITSSFQAGLQFQLKKSTGFYKYKTLENLMELSELSTLKMARQWMKQKLKLKKY
jgi:hypothetical protein